MCFGPSSDLWVFALLFNRKLCSNCHLACSPWDTQWLLREMHFIINVNLYVFMTLLGGRGRQRFPGDICSFLTIYCPRQSRNNDKHCYRKWRVPQWHFLKGKERWLEWFSCGCPPPVPAAAASDRVTKRSCWWHIASPRLPISEASNNPLLSALLKQRGYRGKEGVPLLGSLYCKKVTRLRVNVQCPRCPLALVVSDLLLIDLAWKPCACSSSCETSNQTRSRMVRVCDIVYQSIISIFCFLSLLQSSSVIHTAKQEAWEGMKMVGLGCIGEPKQGHPKERSVRPWLPCDLNSPASPSSALQAWWRSKSGYSVCAKAPKAFVHEDALPFPLGYPLCSTTS